MLPIVGVSYIASAIVSVPIFPYIILYSLVIVSYNAVKMRIFASFCDSAKRCAFEDPSAQIALAIIIGMIMNTILYPRVS